jgi:hypothetical protein
MQHFDGNREYGLSFNHPRAWHEFHYVEISTFETAVVFLSNGPLHDPCNPSMSSPRFAGSTTCEYPAQVLRPGQVVVSWSDGAMPGGPSVPHPTISDEPAEVTTAHPGDCGQYGGQETITAALRIDRDHAFDMMACLRAPNLARDDTLVRQMIASAHFG